MSDFNFKDMEMAAGSDLDSFLSNPSNSEGGAYTGQSKILANLDIPMVVDFDMQGMDLGGANLEPAIERAERSVLAGKQSRVVVASIRDLVPFMRVSSDTLVHKSNRDLWALRKESDGNFYIERLFNDNGSPLKG